MYEVVKQFTGGILKGITITEHTRINMPVRDYPHPCAGSPYRVLSTTWIGD